jgi:hypothetical protein
MATTSRASRSKHAKAGKRKDEVWLTPISVPVAIKADRKGVRLFYGPELVLACRMVNGRLELTAPWGTETFAMTGVDEAGIRRIVTLVSKLAFGMLAEWKRIVFLYEPRGEDFAKAWDRYLAKAKGRS